MAKVTRLTYYPTRVRKVTARVRAIMRDVAKEVKDEVKSEVSIPYPPSSAPMHFPHLRTGTFRDSIRYRTFGEKARIEIYSDDPKSRWLEFGTRSMAPRPTFRLAAQLYMKKFEQRLTSGRIDVR